MPIADSVLQAVNDKTYEKLFWTIDSSEFSWFQEAVDGSANGIAGQLINGYSYHLTAHPPSFMEDRGFTNKGMASSDNPPWE